VGGWQTCSPKPFSIETAVNPGRPTGETLLAIGQRRLEETVEFLRSSDPEAAQAVQADGQARLDELRAMIDAAREGSTFLVRNSSGETRFIELNLRLLDQFESLIAANGAGFAANAAPKASLSPETQRRFIDPSICGLPEELELARLKDARDGVTAGLKLFTELAALVAAVIEAPYLVPASIFIECDEDLNACTDLPPQVVPLSKLGSGPFSAGAGAEPRSSLKTARMPPVSVADSPRNYAAVACCTAFANARSAPEPRKTCRRSPG